MAATTSKPRVVQFGVLEVDLKAGELRKRGVKVRLQEQPFQVLAVLIERAGEVVTKEELRLRIWPSDTFVDFDHGLHSAITRLREALGDSSGSPRFIETLPRRGYRFIAPLKEIGPANVPTATVSAAAEARVRKSMTPIILGLLGIVCLLGVILELDLGGVRHWFGRQSTPEIHSLAVLPLENLSGDTGQEFLADGMTDALITNLAKISALHVVSRTSVMRYKKTRKSAREIAGELNVDGIVEGSVQRVGKQVRISAQLISAGTDRHLWAESYDRQVSDLLRLQDEIAQSIAREIQVKLTTRERTLLAKARPVDPEAYELYLKGRYFLGKSTKDDIEEAITFFQKAISKDPGYAAPYSGLADCYTVLGVSFGVAALSPTQAVSQGRAAAERSILLDDSMAEGHNSLANTKLLFDWDWSGSEIEFRHALELNPGYVEAHHWYAHLLMAEGRRDQALAESNRALELDPLGQVTNLHLGWHYIYSHSYDLAVRQLQKTLELNRNYGYVYWYMGRAYEQQTKYPESLRAMHTAQTLLKGNTAVVADIAHILAISGDTQAAGDLLQQLIRARETAYVSPVEIGLIYLGLDKKVEAFKWFEKGYAERSDLLIYINVDPRFDSIRDDARFQDLVLRIGIHSSQQPNNATSNSRPYGH